MLVSIRDIISGGFKAWANNLKISVPFIVSVVLIGLLWVAYFSLLFFVLAAPVLSQLTMDTSITFTQLADLFAQLTPYVLPITISLIVIWLISLLIQAFFTAGAIGMIKEVAMTGNTSYEDMVNYGKEHFFNFFVLQILYYLILFVGVIFIVPGIIQITSLPSFEPELLLPNIPLLLTGFAVWTLYGIVVMIILSVIYYALVVDKLSPVESIKASYHFFFNNKAEVIVLWLFTAIILVMLNLLSMVFAQFEIISILWGIVNFVIVLL